LWNLLGHDLHLTTSHNRVSSASSNRLHSWHRDEPTSPSPSSSDGTLPVKEEDEEENKEERSTQGNLDEVDEVDEVGEEGGRGAGAEEEEDMRGR